MAVECALITGILLTMAVFFFARKHKTVSWATLPLTLVPLTEFVMFVLVRMFSLEITIFWGIIALVFAVAASCAWIGIAANGFKSRSKKASYVFFANAFNVLLAAILIGNILSSVNDLGELLTA